MRDHSPYRGGPGDTSPIGLVFHKGNRAMFRARLNEAEFIEAVVGDPQTRQEKFDPFPYPPPPDGAPLLYTLNGEAPLQVRHYSGPLDAPSPIAEFHFEAEAKNTLVRVEFCPWTHPWGSAGQPGAPGFLEASERQHPVALLAARCFGRKNYRKAFIALADRHCLSLPK